VELTAVYTQYILRGHVIDIYHAVGTSAEIMKLLGGRGGVICVAQRPHVEKKQIAPVLGPWGWGSEGMVGKKGKQINNTKPRKTLTSAVSCVGALLYCFKLSLRHVLDGCFPPPRTPPPVPTPPTPPAPAVSIAVVVVVVVSLVPRG